MDFATITGLILGFSLVVVSITLGGEFMVFVNVPGLLVVIGGTLSSMLVKHKIGEVIGAVGIMMKAIFVTKRQPELVISQLVDMANIARKDGILALEKVKNRDAFLQGAINHCVDGADPEFLEGVLTKEVEYLIDRHQKGISLWEGVGEIAPAYGLIGTLIGLVQMLVGMSDPSAIGPGLAMAVLASLYGAIIANLIALPISYKLAAYSRDEQMVRRIVIDGMIGIQRGVNPRMLQEALKSALSPKLRNF